MQEGRIDYDRMKNFAYGKHPSVPQIHHDPYRSKVTRSNHSQLEALKNTRLVYPRRVFQAKLHESVSALTRLSIFPRQLNYPLIANLKSPIKYITRRR